MECLHLQYSQVQPDLVQTNDQIMDYIRVPNHEKYMGVSYRKRARFLYVTFVHAIFGKKMGQISFQS